MSKLDLGDLFAVLTKNSEDISEVVDRFGGIANVVRAGPALYRIAKTIADRNEPPDQVVDQMEKALYYNSKTKDRVREFQKKYKLDADGLVGDQTWGKVEELLKGK